jgi:hypothetical protein
MSTSKGNPRKIAYRYTGDGDYHEGIPTKNLTEADVDLLSDEDQDILKTSPLYKAPTRSSGKQSSGKRSGKTGDASDDEIDDDEIDDDASDDELDDDEIDDDAAKES